MTEKYDAIAIGTGQAGPSLAVRLAHAVPKNRHHRAQTLRRNLRQRGMRPDQDPDRECACARRSGAADFGVMIDGKIRVDMARVKAQGCGRARVESRTRRLAEENASPFTVSKATAVSRARTPSVSTYAVKPARYFSMSGRARWFPTCRLTDVSYLTNSSMMEVDFRRNI
jgi:hypothetical protein